MSGFEAMIEEVRFGEDSPLEEGGFEPSVPGSRGLDAASKLPLHLARNRGSVCPHFWATNEAASSLTRNRQVAVISWT
jgi:hypothetical protein